MQFQNKNLQRKKIPQDQTNKDGRRGAIDMETKAYEYETIFQNS